MDGRVLVEALDETVRPEAAPAPETWEPADGPYRQRLHRTRFGRQTYIDFGQRP
jgi:hypothetical protein